MASCWQHYCSQEVTFSEDNRKIYIIKKNQSGTTDSITKSIYWIEKPTVLLTAPWNNPNHLFWDVVVNFFVWKDQGDDLPFKYWSFPDHYPCHSWLCQLMPHVLKVLHLENHIKPLHNLENASTLTSNYPDSYGSILDLHHKDAIKNETTVLLPCYRNAWYKASDTQRRCCLACDTARAYERLSTRNTPSTTAAATYSIHIWAHRFGQS